MAVTRDVSDLIEEIFDQAGAVLDKSYNDRVRQLGDSAYKAGIEATITYLSGKSELNENELKILAAGDIPENIKKNDFDTFIELLNANTNPKLSEQDKSMCYDAFNSGLAAAILYLLEAAHTQDVNLLSLIPSNDT